MDNRLDSGSRVMVALKFFRLWKAQRQQMHQEGNSALHAHISHHLPLPFLPLSYSRPPNGAEADLAYG